MLIPKARGALSAALIDVLHGSSAPATLGDLRPEDEDDLQISLWILFELHHRGFEDLDRDWEWAPDLIGLRGRLEADLEQRWRDRAAHVSIEEPFADSLAEFIEQFESVSVAGFVQSEADREQILELLRHRSVYHLKEADPSSWTLPRLPVRSQAALAALQFDEYGGSRPGRLHRHLFARGMSACGLRVEDGPYVDEAPAIVLEQNNAMAMFGLRGRLRGASMGHLAAFEATSSIPSRRMALGIRRVGLADEMAAYYDEHVEADAVHEQLAIREICATLVEDEPETRPDVIMGTFTCLDLEDRFAQWLLARWSA